MVLSSQKIIVMIVMINLVIGSIYGIWHNPIDGLNVITEKANILTDYSVHIIEDDPLSSLNNPQLQTEPSIGNPVSWGKLLLDILWGGINPISIKPSMFDTQFEKILTTFLSLFRSILAMLFLLEAIFILKNKKWT